MATIMATAAPVLALGARALSGGVLLAAGGAKARGGTSRFLQNVLAYDLLPPAAARGLARALPPVEMGLGACLLLGLGTRPAAVGGLMVLGGVSGAVATALWRGLTIPCGCFGPRERVAPLRWAILGRNLALMLALGGVYAEGGRVLALDRVLAGAGGA